MREPTNEELAYIAGIVDGEGSVGVHGRSPARPASYSIRIGVIMTSPIPPKLCYEVFGGTLEMEKRTTKTGKFLYRWNVYCTKAASVLERLLPYLRVKKAAAEDCIALTKFYKQGRQKRIPEDERQQRDVIYNRILTYSIRGWRARSRQAALEALGRSEVAQPMEEKI